MNPEKITNADMTTPATGQHTTNGIPRGYSSITPHIITTPAAQALDFYRDVLGARIEDTTKFGDVIAHAVLDFGQGKLTLSDAIEDYGLVAPAPTGNVTYSLALYVTDVDSVTAAAKAAGATVREEPATFVSGDRFASILDPFGVRWSIMTRVEDLSPQESAQRVAEWAAQQS